MESEEEREGLAFTVRRMVVVARRVPETRPVFMATVDTIFDARGTEIKERQEKSVSEERGSSEGRTHPQNLVSAIAGAPKVLASRALRAYAVPPEPRIIAAAPCSPS